MRPRVENELWQKEKGHMWMASVLAAVWIESFDADPARLDIGRGLRRGVNRGVGRGVAKALATGRGGG